MRTDSSGRVTSLRLVSNQLSGAIPSQLGNLSNLTRLSLWYNQLSGKIPSQLGNLSNLQYLYLHSNQLSGAIPSQLLNLSNLRALFLSSNQLTGCIPAGFRYFPLTSHDFDELGLPFCDANAPPINAPPIFEVTRSLAENSPPGTNVGAPVAATDPNGNSLTYSLSGNDAGSFEIDAATGQLTTKAGVTYAYETKPSYSVTVTASDGNSGAAAVNVTIQLTAEDETQAPNTAATGAPVIIGTVQVGNTLTVDTSGIADANGLTNVSYSYGWESDGGREIYVVPDPTRFELGPSDVNKRIQVWVTFTDDAGYSEWLTSAATDPVAEAQAPNTPATGAPAITGTVQVGNTLTVDTSGIADANGLTNVSYSYQWLSSRDAAISGAVNSTYQLQPSDANKAIKVRVSFTDDTGYEETLTSAATDPVAAAPPANNAPAFDEGDSATRSLAENSGAGTSVGLPVAATDQDGDTLSYDLRGDDAGFFDLDGSTGQITTRIGVSYDYEAKSTYALTVAAFDGNGGSASISVTISLTDVDETLPEVTLTATAGPDLTGAPGAGVTLQGRGSTNPYGKWYQMAHAWTQLSGPTVTLDNSTHGEPSFTVPDDAADGTTLEFQLTVTDKEGESDSDTMVVTVAAPELVRPTACAGPDLAGAPGERVTLQGTCSANPYGRWHQMAHQWTQLSGLPVTLTHPKTSQPASKFADPSFTIPADAAGGATLEFQLTVTDKEGQPDSDTMVVTVTGAEPENTPPTAAIDAAQVTTAEVGEMVALQGVGGDAETAAESLTFAWSQVGGTPQASIAGASAATANFTAPDVTEETELTFRLTVTDEGGLSATAETTIAISPPPEPEPNRAPAFDANIDTVLTVAENSAAGVNVGAAITATDQDGDTLTYSLSGADAGSFEIDAATGQVTTIDGVTYDYETRSTYSVAVEVSDGNGGAATVAVTVSLTDVNETPSVTSCFTNLDELTTAAEFSGAWDDPDCRAHHQDSSARYIHFTLSEETEVSITLTPESGGALFVSKDTPKNGWGTPPGGTYEDRRSIRRGNGKLVHDGAHTGLNSVTLTLAAGEYTVEAAGSGGTFTLSIKPEEG